MISGCDVVFWKSAQGVPRQQNVSLVPELEGLAMTKSSLLSECGCQITEAQQRGKGKQNETDTVGLPCHTLSLWPSSAQETHSTTIEGFILVQMLCFVVNVAVISHLVIHPSPHLLMHLARPFLSASLSRPSYRLARSRLPWSNYMSVPVKAISTYLPSTIGKNLP